MCNYKFNMLDLKDKKVLLTGATGGIGSAITMTFSKAGAFMCLSGRNESKLTDIASNLPNKSMIFKLDLSDLNQVESFIDEVDKQVNGLDILICNAGVTKDMLSMRMKTEDFQSILDVNLISTFILNRDVAKKMIRKKYGRIINIASVVGITGNPGQANYVASKAGMIGMTKTLALEYATKEITINCIAPGFIKTPMTDVLTDEQKEGILNKIPQKKFGDAQDIANTALFLASDLASYITGQTLHVNGGMLMV